MEKKDIIESLYKKLDYLIDQAIDLKTKITKDDFNVIYELNNIKKQSELIYYDIYQLNAQED